MKCRNCGALVTYELIDLGSAPLSNAYLTDVTLRRPEKWFPLKVLVCEQCWLVQAEAYSRAAEIFNDEYAYFSSFSEAWVNHSKNFFCEIVQRLRLNEETFVVEVASNDGYLLRHFVDAGIPCLGIEPTASTAAVSRGRGIPTVERFFGAQLADEIAKTYGKADLWVGNNVLAHVPDPADFLTGVRSILKEDGIATFEFPHVKNLIEMQQFDTIYHEHFAYLSLSTVVDMMSKSGLEVIDVEVLSTHGGSLRVYAAAVGAHSRKHSVDARLAEERQSRMLGKDYYAGFAEHAQQVKNDFLAFLLKARSERKTVVGYGAAAKGNTLMNYAGVKGDLIQFVADRNPAKQGRYMPGSRIPIVDEHAISSSRPDFVVIFPWNIVEEVSEQLNYVRDWGAKLVTAVPHLKIF